MHDAGDPVKSRFFFLADVAVSSEDDDVAFSFDDPVEYDVPSQVLYQGYSSRADVGVCPGAEGYLVSQMKETGVHAITFCCNGYGFTFSNEFADFCEYLLFVYGNLP